MFEEQRADPREPLELPLKLGDGTAAKTRDISASGMYIEFPPGYMLAGPLQFEMQLAEVGMKFSAHGEIVRVEHKAGGTGVAVRLISPKLEPISEPGPG